MHVSVQKKIHNTFQYAEIWSLELTMETLPAMEG